MPIRDNPLASPDMVDRVDGISALETERNLLHDRCRMLEALIAQHDLLPLPPTTLRVRVGGWDDPDHFLAVGRKIYWDVKRLLGLAGRSLPEFRSILDFGCGAGRLTRYLRSSQVQQVHACDIDAESIRWCQENLGGTGVQFSHTAAMPPLPFEGGSFDLVLAVSVFTHLPEAMQFEWVDELARVIRPGGLLVASTHGETLLPSDVPDEVRTEFLASGFLYAKGFGTPGLPDFYQTAYHRPEYVASRWQRGFHLVHGLPRGINNHQDAYILSRRAPSDDA
jgi:SAM-dependent methyltransferase